VSELHRPEDYTGGLRGRERWWNVAYDEVTLQAAVDRTRIADRCTTNRYGDGPTNVVSDVAKVLWY